MHFLVRGGQPLKGTVTISGAKNAAIKMIAASLLTSEEVRLTNVPDIADVRVDLEVVQALGVKVASSGNELRLKADELTSFKIPAELSEKTRAAIITLGPLLARFGKVVLPRPGGCKIGERPIDRHLKALEALGAETICDDESVELRAERLVGGTIRFEKVTVMGTENALLASVLAEGETVVYGAAQEPEVDDLIVLLTKMGAKIQRDETDPAKITVTGMEKLSGAAHEVLPDRNEAVSYAVAAVATRGDVTLAKIRPQDLTPFLKKLTDLGGSYEVSGEKIRVWADPHVSFKPVPIETVPHPGFVTDWQQPFAVLLTQADGESLIHETVHSQRFDYLAELRKMGARSEILTPTAAGLPFVREKYGFDWPDDGTEPLAVARITGPAKLHGAKVKITDLRAGATLVIAALAAAGESQVYGIEHIDRGYEKFEEKLRGLGAAIERVG